MSGSDYSPSMDSPPPRFQDMGIPQSPRFTEHLHNSPPYRPEQNWGSINTPSPQYGPDDEARGYMGHRLSNKERPLSPELMSPGMESVWAGEGDKEVVMAAPQPTPYERPPDRAEPRRVMGIPKKVFYVLLALLLALGIGLGVGLGVGLGTRKHHSPSATMPSSTPSPMAPAPTPTSTVSTEYLIGGALNPSYFTTTGAFNGSGIALASQSFATNLQSGTQGSLVMYFQHHSGQIRWQQLSSTGQWLGGDESTIVASDAKNSTPLSAVAYAISNVSTWHIFYIDTNNQIKQRTNSNISNVWVDGPINQANLTANDADTVGMQACWYGSDYGDVDYTHTPLPNQGGDAAFSQEVGMHMWYAKDDTTFQQYGWRDGDTAWDYQQDWTELNGHAGVGCYSWGPGTVTYVMFVDLANTVNVFWKDTNSNVTGNATHPINQWTNTSIAINNVNPASSLGYTNYFYAQMADTDMIMGYNISWAAENTTIVTEDTFIVQGEPGLSGTHLSVSAIPNLSGGDELLVFYQTNGSDISEYTRDLVGGQWSSVDIMIPPE